MVNHVRTLLLNLPATTTPDAGEEYVPVNFSPVSLPVTLRAARAALFGSNPSRTELNLQLARLLSFAHTCELADVITAVDDRITYIPTSPAGDVTGLTTQPAYNFVTASAGFPNDSTIFTPTSGTASEIDIRLSEIWNSYVHDALRATALALALANRTAELGGY